MFEIHYRPHTQFGLCHSVHREEGCIQDAPPSPPECTLARRQSTGGRYGILLECILGKFVFITGPCIHIQLENNLMVSSHRNRKSRTNDGSQTGYVFNHHSIIFFHEKVFRSLGSLSYYLKVVFHRVSKVDNIQKCRRILERICEKRNANKLLCIFHKKFNYMKQITNCCLYNFLEDVTSIPLKIYNYNK